MGPYKTILDYIRTIQYNMDHTGHSTFRLIQNDPRPYETIRDNMEPYRTIWDKFGQYETIINHTGP